MNAKQQLNQIRAQIASEKAETEKLQEKKKPITESLGQIANAKAAASAATAQVSDVKARHLLGLATQDDIDAAERNHAEKSNDAGKLSDFDVSAAQIAIQMLDAKIAGHHSKINELRAEIPALEQHIRFERGEKEWKKVHELAQQLFRQIDRAHAAAIAHDAKQASGRFFWALGRSRAFTIPMPGESCGMIFDGVGLDRQLVYSANMSALNLRAVEIEAEELE